jgi:hypothetical protein
MSGLAALGPHLHQVFTCDRDLLFNNTVTPSQLEYSTSPNALWILALV